MLDISGTFRSTRETGSLAYVSGHPDETDLPGGTSGRFVPDSPLERDGFEPSVPRESNGEKAKELVSLVERKVPEMSSTGRRFVDLYKRLFSRLKACVSIRCCKSTE